MSLPPYTPDSDKPLAKGRAVVGVGSAVLAFTGFFFFGLMIVGVARADFFRGVGVAYSVVAGLVGIWVLRAPRFRGFAIGIFGAIACYLLLKLLADGFGRGFWK